MTDGIVATLPELIALKQLASIARAQKTKPSSTAGLYSSRMHGRGMDFADVRHYQAFDEIRHMEWRVTARTGRPHIKLYEEERERPVVFLIDFNPSMYFGTHIAFKSYVAAKLAGLLAWHACLQGDRVGGLLYSSTTHHELTPRRREHGVLPFLARLSAYTAERPNDAENLSTKLIPRPLNDALSRLRYVTKPGSLLIIISDFYTLDELSRQHLSRLQQHNTIIAYQICDRLEQTPPPAGLYPVTDGYNTCCLDTLSHSKAYLEACRLRLETVRTQLQSQHVLTHEVSAQTDLTRLIHQTFPRRTHA